MIFDLPSRERAREAWWQAVPFPHIVVPDFLRPADAAACAAEFPPTDGPWHTFHGPLEEGKQEGAASIAGPNVATLHDTLASPVFLDWLRFVSAIPDLVADPDRHGGGIHQSGPGARLGLHVDFNLHPKLDLLRAVNVIVFVGEGPWPSAEDGLLELHGDLDVVEVVPDPGVFVAFAASDTSWHGHPTPMSADAPLRRSVPAYFYRPIRDGETIEAHSTRFLEPAS